MPQTSSEWESGSRRATFKLLPMTAASIKANVHPVEVGVFEGGAFCRRWGSPLAELGARNDSRCWFNGINLESPAFDSWSAQRGLWKQHISCRNTLELQPSLVSGTRAHSRPSEGFSLAPTCTYTCWLSRWAESSKDSIPSGRADNCIHVQPSNGGKLAFFVDAWRLNRTFKRDSGTDTVCSVLAYRRCCL